MKKKLLTIIYVLITITFFFCSKSHKQRSIETLTNAERVAMFKTMNDAQLGEYFSKQSSEAKEKAGNELAQEGNKFFQQRDFITSFEYMHFANVLLPFKAENNYTMARICSKINRLEDSLSFLKKAVAVDRAYARRSADEEDFKNLRDSDIWRKMVFKIDESTLIGRWMGHRVGIILHLNSDKSWIHYQVSDGIVQETKTGKWQYQKVKIKENVEEHRVIFNGEINETYIAQVETIEGFTLYQINKWYKGDKFFPDFKKRGFKPKENLFEN